MSTDSVGDLVNRLKTAAHAGKSVVEVPYSTFNHAIAEALRAEGFIASVEKSGRKARKHLTVELAFKEDGSAHIHGAKRVSRPGRRVYRPKADIRPSKERDTRTFMTTPQGVMTDRQARSANVGGEVLFTIW